MNDLSFATAFGDFIALAREKVEAFARKHDASTSCPHVFAVAGPRYVRVLKRSAGTARPELWALVEKGTGDIYAAIRGRRAATPSGNIFSGDPTRHVDHQGPYPL